MHRLTNRLTLIVFLFITLEYVNADDIPSTVRNTQNTSDTPPTPSAAAGKITVPKGFNVSLFAGEPAVAQPIAIALDHRGRLWVAEFYSYPTWQSTGNDRIVILEDTDGDGQFDKRKVFWDKGNYLTGIEIGFGGVWVCCAPHLLFIPDKDGDDVPDGEPIVHLDGWSHVGNHTVLNSLVWGPDGWLYGCNGNANHSHVGKPGSPQSERQQLNCGIWRYHPVRREFDVVAHGTANPWGLDFNDYGEGFFTNCVIGHLWHLIPGANYKRIYGRPINPHAYEQLDACSDHYHFTGKNWQFSRGDDGKEVHQDAGGGNAHAGAMVYLGGSWPDSYRNTALMCNLHGNRLNNDKLERKGSGYLGRHGTDFLMANDPWFRGIALRYGPDGGVYVSDWTDLGECHDRDGVHRLSGRIYKISYGKPTKPKTNLEQLGDEQLVKMQLHRNDWFVQHSRRILQQRAAAGKDMSTVNSELLKIFDNDHSVPRKLRALWALHVIGGLEDKWLIRQLDHGNEHIRNWVIRLLCEDKQPPQAAVKKFAALAVDEESPLVRLQLASVLQRMPLEQRWDVAFGLVSHVEDDTDQNLPLMIWYGIEPALRNNPQKASNLAAKSQISKVRQFIARRLASG
ncbi:MAG: putative membrane-bound dehydrogenase-like protein [Pirellulaceae bacterium]|jgi:putative membrane-bound dehydrogenase-like protein